MDADLLAVARGCNAAAMQGAQCAVEHLECQTKLRRGGNALILIGGLLEVQQCLDHALRKHALTSRQIDRDRVLGKLVRKPIAGCQHRQVEQDENAERKKNNT